MSPLVDRVGLGDPTLALDPASLSAFGTMAALFERAEDAHEDCLAFRTTLTAIAITVLANDDGRSNRPLGMVVVEGDSSLIQKRE